MNKKDLILASATKVFAEKGFLNASITEIASAAGVGDATIYSFFRNKEDLLFEIPYNAFVSFLNGALSHLKGLKSPEEKLRKYIWHHIAYYENNKDYTKIYITELSRNSRFYKTKSYQLLKKYSQIVIDILQEGMQAGLFKTNINPYLIRNFIFGSIDNLALSWVLLNKPQSIIEQSDGLTNIVLEAILVDK